MIIFLISAVGAGLLAANVTTAFAWMRHSGGVLAQMEGWINHQAYHVSIWLQGIGFGRHTAYLVVEGLIGLAAFLLAMFVLHLCKRILHDWIDALAQTPTQNVPTKQVDIEHAIRKQAKRDIRGAVNRGRLRGIERADVIYREEIKPILQAEVKEFDRFLAFFRAEKAALWREVIRRNAWKPILKDYRTKLGISLEQSNQELAEIRRRIATEQGIVITPDRGI